ncbi:MAG TPA: YdaU family protein, partial [Burkholderiaceae bacterium]|nr:YdaU family protein [Burkholderiaceae bacterium]
MHYYQHHIGDFLSSTVHMSRVERWIYRDMREVYYHTERPLSSDLNALCRAIGVREDDERQIVTELLQFQFEKTEEGYVQKSWAAEISKYHAKGEQARENGKKGGNRAKPPPVQAEPIGYQAGTKAVTSTYPAPTGSVTNQEPETKNQEPFNTYSTPDGVDVANSVGDPHPARNAKPNCPHEDIINLYHEILPMC